MIKKEIAYNRDISIIFKELASEDFAILLDSGKPFRSKGRYDIFSAWPTEYTQITNAGISHTDSDKINHPLKNLDELKKQLNTSTRYEDPSLPFTTGWLGFASYELSYLLEPHIGEAKHPSRLDLFFAGYYNWSVVQDHLEEKAYFVYEESIAPETLEKLNAHFAKLQTASTEATFELTSPFLSNTPFELYEQQFHAIQHYLLTGDCYQVNLAMQFSAGYKGHPYAAFCTLRAAVPASQMAYINAGQFQILSISPENFIKASGRQISSQPIKGTAARHIDPHQDSMAASALLQSEKNRAENIMIVDLLRNDLSKFCTAGSVKTPSLLAIESYENVHHLVSTISGQLKPEHSIWDVFFGAFPGGSITGAPKIRACQIINELEVAPRDIYCGSIFYASNNGHFDSSITIRTLLCNNNTISAWAGGGIVKDSTAKEEYEECYSKIQQLLDSLSA